MTWAPGSVSSAESGTTRTIHSPFMTMARSTSVRAVRVSRTVACRTTSAWGVPCATLAAAPSDVHPAATVSVATAESRVRRARDFMEKQLDARATGHRFRLSLYPNARRDAGVGPVLHRQLSVHDHVLRARRQLRRLLVRRPIAERR